MKRALFPLILIFLVFSLLPGVTASHLTAPPSSTPVVTPTPSTSVITWSQPTPLRAPVRVALNMDTVWALVVDPQSPGTIYVGTSVGVCKSEDKGGTWRAISAGLPVSEVPALAVDPRATDTLYASSWEWGVFKSTDGGATWQAVNEGLTNPKVQALALDPRAPGTVYAGTYGGGVFKSTDGGDTWQAYNEGLAADTKVLAMAVDPQAPDTVYIGTSEKGVFKSTDGGGTWPAVSEGLTNREVWALAVSSVLTDTVYAGTSGGMFKSTDGGDTWQTVNEGLTNLKVRALALDPEAPDTVYAGTREGGVFKSTDGGDTWQPISPGLIGAVARLAVAPQTPGTIYAGTHGEGVFRSTDGGATWKALAADVIATNVVALAMDPQAPGTVYGGTSGGIFKSTDGGVTWQAVNEGLTSHDVRALAVDPQVVGTIYAGTSGGVFKSSDGGVTWQEVNGGLTNRDVRALAVDPQSPGTVYVGTWRGGMFKSVDGAAIWQKANEGLTDLRAWTLALNPLSPATVYVGTLGGGVFKSVDGAATWQAVNEGLTNLKVRALALNPQAPDTVYAGTEEALLKSVDGGLSWQRLFTKLFISLSVDPLIPQALYATTSADAVASVNLSRDGGVSWEEIGPPEASIKLLVIHASAPQTIYGAAGEAGVFRGEVNRSLFTPRPSNTWLLPLTSLSLIFLLFLTWIHFFIARPNQIPFAMALRLLLAPRQLVLAIGGGYVERNWPDWQHSVESRILHQGRVATETLNEVPHQFRGYTLDKYYREYKDTMRINRSRSGAIELENAEQIIAFFQKWEEVAVNVDAGQRQFASLATDLTNQFCKQLQLRKPLKGPVSYRKISGLVLDVTPVIADTKLPPGLPLLFLRRAVLREGDLKDLRHLLEERLRISSKIALLVIFTEKQLAQEARKMAEIWRSSYAYDVIPIGNTELQQLVFASDPQRALRSLLLSNVNLTTVAPFVTTGPTPATMFFGRELEMRGIAENVKSASYAVISGRRFGKTSILSCLHQVRLPNAGFHTLYHDCATTPTYDTFLAATIHDWRPEPPPNAPATFGDLLQSPTMDKSLVLLLDEADKLLSADRANGWPLFNALRALSNSGRAQVVLSGERTLRDALQDPIGPLFNFADEMLLGPLDFHAVKELVTWPMKQLEIELIDEAGMVRRIYAFTSGHPNVVQRLCHRLIERLNEQGTRRITMDDVNAVIEDPKFQEIDFLQTYWLAASPLEKIITLVLSQEARTYCLKEVRQLLSEQAHIQPSATATKDALDQLVDLRSILKRSQTGYAFAVEAFPLALANTTTVEDLLEVLVEQYKQTEGQT